MKGRPAHDLMLRAQVQCHVHLLLLRWPGERIDEVVLLFFSKIAKFARAETKSLLEDLVECRRSFVANTQRNFGDRAGRVFLQHANRGDEVNPSQEVKWSLPGVGQEDSHEMK